MLLKKTEIMKCCRLGDPPPTSPPTPSPLLIPPPPPYPPPLLHHLPSSITSAPPHPPPPHLPSSSTSLPPSPPHHPPPPPTSPPAPPPSVHRSFVFFNWLLCVRDGRRWAPTVTCSSLPGLVVQHVFPFPIHTGQQGASSAPRPAQRHDVSSSTLQCHAVSRFLLCRLPSPLPFPTPLSRTTPPPPHTHTHTYTHTHLQPSAHDVFIANP